MVVMFGQTQHCSCQLDWGWWFNSSSVVVSAVEKLFNGICQNHVSVICFSLEWWSLPLHYVV